MNKTKTKIKSGKKISLEQAKKAGGKRYREKVLKGMEKFKKLSEEEKHQIHIYYGYGKGKTTASVGLAIRALGAGKKVAIVEFDKGYDDGSEHYYERKIFQSLRELDYPIELYSTGCNRMNEDGTFRFKNSTNDFEEAKRGLLLAKKLITKGKQDLLILDEIIAAVNYHLIEEKDVFDLIKLYNKSRKFELVLTGHKLFDGLEEKADLITEMHKIKHYFDKGIQARKGIEY